MQKETLQLSVEKNYPIIFFWTKSRFVNTKILKPSYFAENTTNMASLKIGAVPHSDERYITKLKFFKLRYKDLFFSVKAVILLFSNMKLRRPPGGFPKLYFSLKFWLSFKKCWKNDKYSTSENRWVYSLWWKIRYKT